MLDRAISMLKADHSPHLAPGLWSSGSNCDLLRLDTHVYSSFAKVLCDLSLGTSPSVIGLVHLYKLDRLARGNEQRIPHRRIGRSVTQVQIDHFVHGQPRVQGDRHRIYPLGRAFDAYNLSTQ